MSRRIAPRNMAYPEPGPGEKPGEGADMMLRHGIAAGFLRAFQRQGFDFFTNFGQFAWNPFVDDLDFDLRQTARQRARQDVTDYSGHADQIEQQRQHLLV